MILPWLRVGYSLVIRGYSSPFMISPRFITRASSNDLIHIRDSNNLQGLMFDRAYLEKIDICHPFIVEFTLFFPQTTLVII